ncbi:hypothetical protein CQA61_30255, partial [Klebsiella pneumoniae]
MRATTLTPDALPEAYSRRACAVAAQSVLKVMAGLVADEGDNADARRAAGGVFAPRLRRCRA